MQESWPGHVPTGWGGRALQSASSLSSLCKQQRHTDSLCVCAHAGGLWAQGTHRHTLQMGALAAMRRPEVGVGPADTCQALTMSRLGPFIGSFNPYTLTSTPWCLGKGGSEKSHTPQGTEWYSQARTHTEVCLTPECSLALDACGCVCLGASVGACLVGGPALVCAQEHWLICAHLCPHLACAHHAHV